MNVNVNAYECLNVYSLGMIAKSKGKMEMNNSQFNKSSLTEFMRQTFLAFIFMLGFAANAHGALITYDFTGVFIEANSLFNSGDTFSGSYTFESNAVVFPHPDPSFDFQSVAIDDSVWAGTGWDLTVFSSVMPEFSLSGKLGVIAVSDDTVFGDRYIVTLFSEIFPLLLPDGLPLNFFQIDLQDSIFSGADMLSSAALENLPDLSLAAFSSGRFFIYDNLAETEACTQCHVSITSLTESSKTGVPEPSTMILMGFGFAMFPFRRKLSKISTLFPAT